MLYNQNTMVQFGQVGAAGYEIMLLYKIAKPIYYMSFYLLLN